MYVNPAAWTLWTDGRELGLELYYKQSQYYKDASTMRPFIAPDPTDLINEHAVLGLELYATLAECPLYANARLLALQRNILGRRRSFWLGYVIEEGRLAKGRDCALIPEDVREWVQQSMRAEFPSLPALGMSFDEIAELKAEQAAKRKPRK